MFANIASGSCFDCYSGLFERFEEVYLLLFLHESIKAYSGCDRGLKPEKPVAARFTFSLAKEFPRKYSYSFNY